MSSVDGWVRPQDGWRCPECAFAFDVHDIETMQETIRHAGSRFRAPLTRGLPGEDMDALLRTRPARDMWSALEYAAHLRDALLLTDHRITKAVTRDRPSFRVGDREAVAIERAYNAQDPLVVADEIVTAADALASTLATLDPDAWDREGFAGEDPLTVRWMACNAAHEATHHLLDAARSLRTARGR